MFASLFHKVYDEFHKQKRLHNSFPRPLPMIAEHLRAAAGPSIKGLISEFMKTEFAGNPPDELFPWMIDNGQGFWMTDGLDEVITSDDEFMDFLLERFTQPSSSSAPLMLMSLRDSLLESREQLHDFIGTEGVHLINLLPWESQQKRSFAWTKVYGRLPRETDSDDPRVKDLVKVLTKDEHDGLSSTPFYADMLADEFLAASSLASRNEFDLLDSAVSAMCRREYEKDGPIQETVLPIENFRDWLEEVAGEAVKSGISIDELEVLSELVLVLITEDITPDETRALVNQMKVMPFLKTNPISAKFEFTHEILGEFLAGSFYAKQMQVDAGRDWGSLYLDQQALPGNSMLLKVMAWNFREKRDELVKAIHECPSSTILLGNVHRNIVQLLALMDNGRDLLDRSPLSLERADLSRVQFGSMDLQGVSFVGSDLSHTDLSKCNLQQAIFESAQLSDTFLPSIRSRKLEQATFDKIRFESIRHGERDSISSYGAFLDWAENATNVPKPRDIPCPSFRQLEALFGRFFHPSGEPRRHLWIPDRTLLRGGPNIRDTVDKVCQFDYLTRTHRPRSGASRPTANNDRYREIVDFMRDSVLSPSLRDLLADLCRKPDCRHTAF